MSGGSHDYTWRKVEYECVGKMFDDEMDEMMKDLVDVLHDVEWWQSGDIDEEDYRETLEEFKIKWFGTRDDNLRQRLAEKMIKNVAEILQQ